MNKKKSNTSSSIILFLAIGGLMYVLNSCKTPKFTCPAYNELKHHAFADSTDPSNSIKMYTYYPVMEEGGSDSTFETNMTSTEGMEDDSKTNEEIMHESDMGKEKEEEWKPYAYFNIKMGVDSLGKPTSFKPVKLKYNGLVDKKKPKDINVDKELSEDKKKKGYTIVEQEAALPQ